MELPRKSVQWYSRRFMQTGRQTDMTRLLVAFRICFANAPKKELTHHCN